MVRICPAKRSLCSNVCSRSSCIWEGTDRKTVSTCSIGWRETFASANNFPRHCSCSTCAAVLSTIKKSIGILRHMQRLDGALHLFGQGIRCRIQRFKITHKSAAFRKCRFFAVLGKFGHENPANDAFACLAGRIFAQLVFLIQNGISFVTVSDYLYYILFS